MSIDTTRYLQIIEEARLWPAVLAKELQRVVPLNSNDPAQQEPPEHGAIRLPLIINILTRRLEFAANQWRTPLSQRAFPGSAECQEFLKAEAQEAETASQEAFQATGRFSCEVLGIAQKTSANITRIALKALRDVGPNKDEWPMQNRLEPRTTSQEPHPIPAHLRMWLRIAELQKMQEQLEGCHTQHCTLFSTPPQPQNIFSLCKQQLQRALSRAHPADFCLTFYEDQVRELQSNTTLSYSERLKRVSEIQNILPRHMRSILFKFNPERLAADCFSLTPIYTRITSSFPGTNFAARFTALESALAVLPTSTLFATTPPRQCRASSPTPEEGMVAQCAEVVIPHAPPRTDPGTLSPAAECGAHVVHLYKRLLALQDQTRDTHTPLSSDMQESIVQDFLSLYADFRTLRAKTENTNLQEIVWAQLSSPSIDTPLTALYKTLTPESLKDWEEEQNRALQRAKELCALLYKETSCPEGTIRLTLARIQKAKNSLVGALKNLEREKFLKHDEHCIAIRDLKAFVQSWERGVDFLENAEWYCNERLSGNSPTKESYTGLRPSDTASPQFDDVD